MAVSPPPAGSVQPGGLGPPCPNPPVAWTSYPPVQYGVPMESGGDVRPLAGMGARLGTRVLDIVFRYAGYMTLAFPVIMWIDRSDNTVLPRVAIGIWLLVSFVLYFPLCLPLFGSTLGKRICGVRIVRPAWGQRVGFWRTVGREFFWGVTILIPVLSFLNPLWCCWGKPLRQCLHDKVANTVAVSRRAA